MIPNWLTLAQVNSDTFIQEFRRGERHIVCIADQNHPIVEQYTGVNFYLGRHAGDLAERLNEAMEWANAEGFATHFYNDYNFALTVLPQLVYSCEEWPSQRNDYVNRPFISRCIKAVFNFNREAIHAPKITFVFESRNFNTTEGIELMYHYATSNMVRKDRDLVEISYWDVSIEPDQDFIDGHWVLAEN